jgi:hypothetical protein
MIQLGYLAGGDRHSAEWTWDPARRQLRSYGAAARALMAPSPDDAVASADDEPAPGLRMVPPREPRPAAAPPQQPADETDSQRKHPAGRARGRKDAPEEPDGVSRRAVVPSWDDIMFGIRRPDEGS